MRASCFICPILGAIAAFAGTLVLLRFLGEQGYEWVDLVLAPGIAVAEMTSNVTSSISHCVIAGVFTMTLMGALFGSAIELLVGMANRSRVR